MRYGFVHVLYQNALYASLQPTRRAARSAAAARLLGHYGEKSGDVAAELAMLFEAARDFARPRTISWWRLENAARIFANQEAVVLAQRGVELLASLPDTPEAQRARPADHLGPGPLRHQGLDGADVETAYTGRKSCAVSWENRRISSRRCGDSSSSISARGDPDGTGSGRAVAQPGPTRQDPAYSCRRITRWDRPMPSSEIGRSAGYTWSRRSLTMTAVSTARMPFSTAAMTHACAA